MDETTRLIRGIDKPLMFGIRELGGSGCNLALDIARPCVLHPGGTPPDELRFHLQILPVFF